MKNKIVKTIIAENKIALFGHQRPDGDSISSSYGLAKAIKSKFPNKEVVWVVDMEYIKNSFPDKKIDMSFVKTEIDNSYVTIVGDVSTKERIDHYEEYSKGKIKICFDHHQNVHNCNPDIFWHEPTYPASTIQAIEIVKDLNVKLNEDLALELLIGILTDTGFFKFSLANPIPPKYYSEMLEYISDETMSNFLNNFSKRTKEDMAITSMIMSNIKYEGRVAYVINEKEMVEKYGVHKVKAKVNLIANIENYPIWALFTHIGTGEEFPWEASLRSNGPQVNLIASKFNGGGHIRASGAKLKNRKQIQNILNELNK